MNEYWEPISKTSDKTIIRNKESGQYFAWTKQYGWHLIDKDDVY